MLTRCRHFLKLARSKVLQVKSDTKIDLKCETNMLIKSSSLPPFEKSTRQVYLEKQCFKYSQLMKQILSNKLSFTTNRRHVYVRHYSKQGYPWDIAGCRCPWMPKPSKNFKPAKSKETCDNSPKQSKSSEDCKATKLKETCDKNLEKSKSLIDCKATKSKETYHKNPEISKSLEDCKVTKYKETCDAKTNDVNPVEKSKLNICDNIDVPKGDPKSVEATYGTPKKNDSYGLSYTPPKCCSSDKEDPQVDKLCSSRSKKADMINQKRDDRIITKSSCNYLCNDTKFTKPSNMTRGVSCKSTCDDESASMEEDTSKPRKTCIAKQCDPQKSSDTCDDESASMEEDTSKPRKPCIAKQCDPQKSKKSSGPKNPCGEPSCSTSRSKKSKSCGSSENKNPCGTPASACRSQFEVKQFLGCHEEGTSKRGRDSCKEEMESSRDLCKKERKPPKPCIARRCSESTRSKYMRSKCGQNQSSSKSCSKSKVSCPRPSVCRKKRPKRKTCDYSCTPKKKSKCDNVPKIKCRRLKESKSECKTKEENECGAKSKCKTKEEDECGAKSKSKTRKDEESGDKKQMSCKLPSFGIPSKMNKYTIGAKMRKEGRCSGSGRTKGKQKGSSSGSTKCPDFGTPSKMNKFTVGAKRRKEREEACSESKKRSVHTPVRSEPEGTFKGNTQPPCGLCGGPAPKKKPPVFKFKLKCETLKECKLKRRPKKPKKRELPSYPWKQVECRSKDILKEDDAGGKDDCQEESKIPAYSKEKPKSKKKTTRANLKISKPLKISKIKPPMKTIRSEIKTGSDDHLGFIGSNRQYPWTTRGCKAKQGRKKCAIPKKPSLKTLREIARKNQGSLHRMELLAKNKKYSTLSDGGSEIGDCGAKRFSSCAGTKPSKDDNGDGCVCLYCGSGIECRICPGTCRASKEEQASGKARKRDILCDLCHIFHTKGSKDLNDYFPKKFKCKEYYLYTDAAFLDVQDYLTEERNPQPSNAKKESK